MHKVLGDIIDDHKTDYETPDQAKKQESGKNVISISELAEKRKQ
jgi:hypothetical protein